MPNCFPLTFAGVRTVSFRFAPVRARSLCCVSTSTWARAASGSSNENEKIRPCVMRCGKDNQLNPIRAILNDLLLICGAPRLAEFAILRSAELSNWPIHYFLSLRIPIEPLATPVRLCGHDRHNRMRETMIHIGIRFLPRLHYRQPVHDVNEAVVARPSCIRGFCTRNLHYLLVVPSWSDDRQPIPLDRSGIFISAAFLADREERGAFAAIVRDRTIASLDS